MHTLVMLPYMYAIYMIALYAELYNCIFSALPLADVKIFKRPQEQSCAALLAFVSMLWCTEALPLYITSILIPLLAGMGLLLVLLLCSFLLDVPELVCSAAPSIGSGCFDVWPNQCLIHSKLSSSRYGIGLAPTAMLRSCAVL